MDFGSLLQNEISKKKQILSELAQEKEANKSTDSDSKYLKASSIREREYEYEEEERYKAGLENEKNAMKRKVDTRELESHVLEGEVNKKMKLEERPNKEDHEIEINPKLIEAQESLRGLGEPVRLFGESDTDVILRLDRIMNKGKQDEKVEEVETDANKEDEKLKEERSLPNTADDNGPDQQNDLPVTEPVVDQQQQQQPIEQGQLVIKDEDFIVNKQDVVDNIDKVSLQIRDYIKFIFTSWDAQINKMLDINLRDQEVAISKETKKWVLPLLVRLKKQNLDSELLVTLSTVIINMQEGNFLKANENYLKLSIGNVSWPIGVVNVGIHSRSNHSKIMGKENISNIMKDDVTRKWILGVKRLISLQEKSRK